MFTSCVQECWQPAWSNTAAVLQTLNHLYAWLPSWRIGLPLLCGVQGTIPAAWGTNAMFPKLANLSLAYNSPLSGTLPASWGADNSSLTGLQLFQANNCNLTGPLPANWSTYLPALKDINISSNGLTGVILPP